jgi:hypothetical protein
LSDTFKPVPVLYAPKTYPMIAFLVRHGRGTAWAIGLVPLIVSLCMLMAGFPAWTLLIGVGACVVATGLLLSYVELVCVIEDMLLPK